MWVAHEDSSLDGLQGIASKGSTRATAESIVHDLATLFKVSRQTTEELREVYLRVSDEDNLGAGALLVVGCDSLDDGSGSLGGRVVIADASTR